MELDRQHIARDFQLVRRGYDPDEVDRHLRAIADAIEQQGGPPSGEARPSMAAIAAERVQSIVAAAEASASEIEDRARSEAHATRTSAESEAASRLHRAKAVAERLGARADELDQQATEVLRRLEAGASSVVASLRSGAQQLRAEFEAMGAPVDDEELDAEPYYEDEDEPEPEPERQPQPEAPAPAQSGGGEPAERERGSSGATEGARLIALNMALAGTPRAETARYLEENFDLTDQDELLDDVYTRAGS